MKHLKGIIKGAIIGFTAGFISLFLQENMIQPFVKLITATVGTVGITYATPTIWLLVVSIVVCAFVGFLLETYWGKNGR